MTPEQRIAAEHDAGRTITRFFHLLDDRGYEEQVNLLAPDGVWHRQGVALRGREMLMEAMRARKPDVRTQHLITSLLVDATGPDAATAVFHLMVFSHTGPENPAPMSLPGQIATYKARLVRQSEGWRILELGSTQKFKR